jgi:hypothetical protein
MKKISLFLLVAFAVVSAYPLFAASNDKVKFQINLTRKDVSRPLRDMVPAKRAAGVRMVRPNFQPPVAQGPINSDQAWQSAALATNVPSTSGQFEAIGEGLGSYNAIYVPPDTNGDVGPNHYVQTVNTDLAVFSKTGTLLYGPVPINTLWSGFGNSCATRNDGDPTVTYDQFADRWIIAQFTTKRPYLECVAVSTGPSPTGSYYRYSYSFGNLPDYPKVAVWPANDSYVATYNMFGGTFKGAAVCAMQRSKLIGGATNSQQCVQLSASYYTLLAADNDGATAATAGTDEWVMSAYNGVKYWKFHVDWANTANTKLTGPTSLGVASYTEACSGSGGSCVPQKGTTQKLDTLSSHVMNRLAYRKLSDHEAIVANHTVSVSGINAVRWYELRPSGSSLTIFQQGTFSPDTTHRWMGSIAMDKFGNIAMGYSASSGSINPAIRYTGRVPTDAAGSMQAEASVIEGTGSQLSYTRWGDYSSIQADPVDDCTFFYTTEYLTANGSFNWHTRVASFKLPGCQ